jgi:hypothetical protein
MTSGGYYLSGSDAQLTFAAHADSGATIEVRWRSGRRSVIDAARANRLYEISETDAVDAGTARVATPNASPAGTSLFTNASSLLGGATHTDSLFADFRRQPLLPTRLSQLGPGVSWIDVDLDGQDDLVFGGGRGGRLTVLRSAKGRFTPLSLTSAIQAYDLTTVLPSFNGQGHLSLLAGQSSYETGSAADALALPSVVAFPIGGSARAGAPVAAVAGDTTSVGALCMADVNADGVLDLFVAARSIPGAWPLPGKSRLLLGTSSGAFVVDSTNIKALSALGLVSDAIFADLDGDARPDLVLATEFGPIRVLHNDNGSFRDVTRSMGLGGRSSRWNGIAVGDFDSDGRLDLIATSWGRNIPWQATESRPYTLTVSRSADDRLALLFGRADSITQREMPLDGFSRIGAAMPSVKERFATFADFARADVDALLGADAARAIRVGATTFEHTLFLNRGDHFEASPLPTAAQLAPAFAAVVADYDGNGTDDVFLGQNFFPTEINTMRFDAGAGLLLLGNGHGLLTPQTTTASGIAVRGESRGAAAADFDADGRVDLAVSQNGGPMTLWRNATGLPGLRVRLRGPASNPFAIGAQLRVKAEGMPRPLREIHAGGGYWSMNAATQVLAIPAGTAALWVRWPDGQEQTVTLPPGQREVTLTHPKR